MREKSENRQMLPCVLKNIKEFLLVNEQTLDPTGTREENILGIYFDNENGKHNKIFY